MLKEQTAQITEQVEALLNPEREELVDVRLRKAGRQVNIEVTVDRPDGGITMDECASINRRIAGMMEEKNFFEEYAVEVVSPGLDRPLTTEKDFLRNRQRSIRFFLKEPLDGKTEWVGTIEDVSGGKVEVSVDGQQVQISIGMIQKAVHNI